MNGRYWVWVISTRFSGGSDRAEFRGSFEELHNAKCKAAWYGIDAVIVDTKRGRRIA